MTHITKVTHYVQGKHSKHSYTNNKKNLLDNSECTKTNIALQNFLLDAQFTKGDFEIRSSIFCAESRHACLQI
jgi:hypothetical protein